MKRLVRLLIFVTLLFCFYLPVNAKSDVVIYFFHGDGCPHCALEDTFLRKIIKSDTGVKVVKYEVFNNKKNSELLSKVMSYYNIEKTGVPLTIIGNTYFLGYSDTMDNTVKRAIEYYKKHDYVDNVNRIINNDITLGEVLEKDDFSIYDKKSDEAVTVNSKLFGKINLKRVSISSAAIIIGLTDGFNPCAMWVLLFLISMLIGMKDKKKMIIYGISFLVSSALLYMFFMFSWVNIVIKATTSIFIRNVIAIIALCGAGFNLYSFIKSRKNGCIVVSSKKRGKIFERIRHILSNRSFILGLLGIIGLAFSVNVVELACSAGLPLIFTQLLAINNIGGVGAFLYILLYIFFFLLDDMIVFLGAVYTMKITGLSTKFSKYSHLLGFIFMFIIGILLLWKPEWLMFQFK